MFRGKPIETQMRHHSGPTVRPLSESVSYQAEIRLLGELTLMMVTPRIMDAVMTNAAPENNARRGILRFRLILTFQRRGKGIESR